MTITITFNLFALVFAVSIFFVGIGIALSFNNDTYYLPLSIVFAVIAYFTIVGVLSVW